MLLEIFHTPYTEIEKIFIPPQCDFGRCAVKFTPIPPPMKKQKKTISLSCKIPPSTAPYVVFSFNLGSSVSPHSLHLSWFSHHWNTIINNLVGKIFRGKDQLSSWGIFKWIEIIGWLTISWKKIMAGKISAEIHGSIKAFGWENSDCNLSEFFSIRKFSLSIFWVQTSRSQITLSLAILISKLESRMPFMLRQIHQSCWQWNTRI